MSIARHFLGWSAPALPAAGDWLVSRYAREGELDLGKVIVVVPGARAGRRLVEILIARAEERNLILTPPTIATEYALPELLYQPRRPFANPLTQQLVWSQALQGTPEIQRRHLLPRPPTEDDALRWLELGELLRTLHLELAADGLSFKDVLAGADHVEGFAEHNRWRALAGIQDRYHQRLDALDLWDKQTARLVAIERKEPTTDCEIVLLGTVDLNRAARRMLDLVADRVTALVFAPEELADRFDPHGCLAVEPWTKAILPIEDAQIERVDGPGDQAAAVTRWLASLGGKYRADGITVGVPDESLVPQLQRELAQNNVPARWVVLQQLGETGPFRLLRALADLGQRGRFRDLAALVRHPDVFDWLWPQVQGAFPPGTDPLTELDRFAADQIPATLEANRLEGEKFEPLKAVHETIGQLLKLVDFPQQSPAQWAAAFRQVLVAVYGQRELDRQVPAEGILIASLERIEAGLAELDALPAGVAPPFGLRDAFLLALAPLAKEPIPPAPDAAAVEILGWLELPLDDAPALVITTFNDRFVPQAKSSDLFLPNRLRHHLGVDHNDRRYARDAYALSLILHSRRDVRLIVGHRDAEGNPLAPSRLLFAADEETVARRALVQFGDLPPSPPRRSLLTPAGGTIRAVSAIDIPRPQPVSTAVTEMSVTSFRAYLACPYRYYLQYVLGLEALDDAASELNPAAFGKLLHDVMERFGRLDDAKRVRESTESEAIYEYFSDQLGLLANARFGLKHCRPAVRVQIEQARTRFRTLAEWQALRTRSGWQIVHGEDTERRLQVDFDVDGQPVKLVGRIDRIDYHPEKRSLSVLDYKTADSGHEPRYTHVKQGQWIDLQLPLYRHLVRGAPLGGVVVDGCEIGLGYIRLAKDVRQIGDALADWQPSELAAADEVARWVVRNVRAQKFWPRIQPPPAFSEELAIICQDHRLGTWHAAPEGDAA